MVTKQIVRINLPGVNLEKTKIISENFKWKKNHGIMINFVTSIQNIYIILKYFYAKCYEPIYITYKLINKNYN